MRDLEGGGATKPHTFPFLRDSSVADATRRFSSCRLSNSTQDLVRCVVPLPRCPPFFLPTTTKRRTTMTSREEIGVDWEAYAIMSFPAVESTRRGKRAYQTTRRWRMRDVSKEVEGTFPILTFFPSTNLAILIRRLDKVLYDVSRETKVSVFSICVIDTKRLWRGSIEIIALEDIALTGKNLSR